MKQKRKPGAGRKPSGPFAHNNAQLTVRMPDDLRTELERSANKKGWSLTQELLWRLRSVYNKQRAEERRAPEVRAICFLIGSLAKDISFFTGSGLHRDPFAFRTLRLATARLLEALEPAGEVKSPYDAAIAAYNELKSSPNDSAMARGIITGMNFVMAPSAVEAALANLKTPETFADGIVRRMVEMLLNPSDLSDFIRQARDNVSGDIRRAADELLDITYGITDAKRDLGIGDLRRPAP